MDKYIFNNNTYELIENYRDGFDSVIITEMMTDYFHKYDYIIGDWAYGKIRLKGFCVKANPHYKKINSYYLKDRYLKEDCAYDCRYFILKKIK